MKTKVRIQYAGDNNSEYEHCYIEVLDRRSKWGHAGSLEVIGSISFQGTRSEKGTREDYWYALSYSVNADRLQSARIVKMAKLAKYIEENTDHNIQPEQLLLLIGAEMYIHGAGGFIPESYKGLGVYRLMKDNQIYTFVHAANEIVAQRLAKKKYPNCIVEFDHIVK